MPVFHVGTAASYVPYIGTQCVLVEQSSSITTLRDQILYTPAGRCIAKAVSLSYGYPQG